MDVLLFGDQTADQYPLLRKLTQRKDNAIVSTFLDRVSVALRDETRKLPRSRREVVPDFLNVSNLIEAYFEKGVKVPELESSLVTICQLAHYIGYVSLSNRPRFTRKRLRRRVSSHTWAARHLVFRTANTPPLPATSRSAPRRLQSSRTPDLSVSALVSSLLQPSPLPVP